MKRVFGWVRDMYAFDFAARKVGVTVHYPPVPLNKLMVQPPADADLGAGCLMHYTWSPILSDREREGAVEVRQAVVPRGVRVERALHRFGASTTAHGVGTKRGVQAASRRGCDRTGIGADAFDG